MQLRWVPWWAWPARPSPRSPPCGARLQQNASIVRNEGFINVCHGSEASQAFTIMTLHCSRCSCTSWAQ